MLIELVLMAAASNAPLSWLVGRWCTDPVGGKQTCETWTPMSSDQTMHGISETPRPGGDRSTERMTIINDAGRLVFHAEPDGQAPTDFHSTARDYAPPDLEFLNSAHDYPQRIRYWREGELLMAEIAMADGSRPVRWTYRRKK